MYRVKNVPEYDGMEYGMFMDKVPGLKPFMRPTILQRYGHAHVFNECSH